MRRNAFPMRKSTTTATLHHVLLLAFIITAWGKPEPVVAQNAQPPSNVDLSNVLPETSLNPDIKSPEQFFGFQLGSRHLFHHQIVAYSKYLDEASDRVQLIYYAQSHGKRPLLVLMVTRDADSQDFDQLQQQRQRLTTGVNAEATDLSDMKTLAYVGYSIHGDEASGMNAFPAIAYYLAAGDDPLVDQVLDKSILLLDPCLNPDGSERFANWVNENRGRFPSDNENDREHSQAWPRGRTNYYWFDLNRDWLPTAHPESKGRIELFHQWKPDVVLDFHEMGSSSSYFFQPGIPERNNPLTPDSVFQLTRKFAKEHAQAMDSADELYFTEERFDDFYMGKGSTYPDLHGAIGILFEQGSTRGLLSKNDRYTRTFAETVSNQIRTSISSLRAIVDLQQPLLEHKSQFYRDALEMAAKSPIRAYILHANGDQSRVNAAAELLKRHDIQVWQPKEEITVDGNTFHAGSVLIVPTDQPEYRFLQSLMQTEQSFRENIFYDVSAWTLPFAFDLDVIGFRSDLPETWKGNSEPTASTSAPPTMENAIAIAIDPVSLDAPQVVGKLMNAGFNMRVAYDPFVATTSEGEQVDFQRGTWLVLKPTNKPQWSNLAKQLEAATANSDVEINVLTSGLSPTGPDLGSDSNRDIPSANIMLVVGDGTSALDAGALWHYLDHRLEMPATLVNADSIGRTDLNDFTCIILPAGSYSGIGDSTTKKLDAYVANGGTVIAIDSSIRWLQSQNLIGKNEPSSDENKDEIEVAPPKRFADASDAAALEGIAGAIFSATIDNTHPLAFGFPDDNMPIFRDSTAKYPVPKNTLTTAATYTGVLAGYVSERNRQQLNKTAAVWAENKGSGRIICIADNPVFRGYFRSSERFLSNAILLGPSLRIPNNLSDEAADEHGHGH